LHQVGNLFELNVKLRCQNVKYLFKDDIQMCCHNPVIPKRTQSDTIVLL